MEIAITIKSNTAKEAAVLLGKALVIMTEDLTDEFINSGRVQVAAYGIDFDMKVTK